MTAQGAKPDRRKSAEPPAATAAVRKTSSGRDVGRTLWRPKTLDLQAPVYQQVADQLREAIFEGKLSVGDVLPGENDLATQFGVGRGTVREALRLLASQGFLLTTRGVKGGSVVSHPSIQGIQEYLVSTIGFLTDAGETSIDMIIEARELLEIPAAGLAAERRLVDLDQHVRTADSIVDHPAVLRSNRDFHIMLIRSTGNALLELMLRPFLSVLHASLPPSSAAIYERLDREHAAIAKSIHNGNVDGSMELMRKHLQTLRKLYGGILHS
jgi:DNA-binding FadR family transcriptional regulator